MDYLKVHREISTTYAINNFALEHSDPGRAVHVALKFLIEIGNVKKVKNNLYVLNEEKYPIK